MTPAIPTNSNQVTAQMQGVDMQACSQQLEQSLHMQGFDVLAQEKGFDITAKEAPIQYKLGMTCANGRTVDYSSKLSDENQKKLVEILNAYGLDDANFSIDLTHFLDGNGRPLQEKEGRDLEADLATLRKIADETVGASKIRWLEYPKDWRAPRGQIQALSTGHSERLQKLHWDNEKDLEKLIERLRTVQAPTKDKDAGQMTLEAQEKTKVGLARNHGAIASMAILKATLRQQIQHLRNERGPDVAGRIDKLQKLLEQLPEAGVPENAKDEKARQANGQSMKRWAVIHGATHLLQPGEQIDGQKLDEMQKAAEEAVEKLSKPSKDCDGFLDKLNPWRDLSESNQHTEHRFIQAIALLGAKTKEDYEAWRRYYKADETSDGPELLLVRLADAMATGQSEEEIGALMHGPALQIALGSLDPKDITECSEVIQDRACKWQKALRTAGERFTAMPDWKSKSTHELCTLYAQGIPPRN